MCISPFGNSDSKDKTEIITKMISNMEHPCLFADFCSIEEKKELLKQLMIVEAEKFYWPFDLIQALLTDYAKQECQIWELFGGFVRLLTLFVVPFLYWCTFRKFMYQVDRMCQERAYQSMVLMESRGVSTATTNSSIELLGPLNEDTEDEMLST